jgi:hypothetical protein
VVDESEVISNSEPGAVTDRLEVELHPNNVFFDYIKVQCLLKKRRNYKHICYVELHANQFE